MIEVFNVPDEVVVILGVIFTELFYYSSLCFCRIYVLLHWLYDLTVRIVTFIAKLRS